jgi:uncharacterized membrane protein YeaQ/YmgE (transglycosylase-associated protein family)
MGLLAWIVLGALAGWLASIITGRNDQMGCLTNIIVGIIGAFIGGFIMSQLGGSDITGFNLYSFLVATMGSIILLVVLGLVRGK